MTKDTTKDITKDTTKDMTSGSPLGLILKFAFPLLLGNLFQQTYNLVDAAIVGRFLGTVALGSVGASSSVQFLVLGFCIGICCGFAIPIAQRFGARDYESMRTFVFNAAILTIIAAVILTGVCIWLCTDILKILSTPDDIFTDAYRYLLVIFIGIPCTLLYNLLSGIMRALGDSKTPFIYLAIATVLNIVLDLFCILVLHWGCMGAALATITAQGIGGILCLISLIRKYPLLRFKEGECHLDRQCIKILGIMGIPMGLQYSITAIGSMVMQSANNNLGSVYVSAFTASNRLKMFCICPFDALATAVSTFCSQNYGARKVKRIKEGILQGTAVGIVYGILIGIILIFFGRTMSMIFVNSGAVEVLDASGHYLYYAGFFYWTLGILNVVRMSTQGLGYSGRAIFSGVVEMIARTVVSLVFVPMYGFLAICFADQTAWVTAVLYIVPTCIYCVKKIEKQFAVEQ